MKIIADTHVHTIASEALILNADAARFSKKLSKMTGKAYTE